MGWDAQVLEWCVALGHIVVWVAIFNRMHATGIPRWSKKLGERIIYVLLLGVGLFVWGSDLVRYSVVGNELETMFPDSRVAIGLGIELPAWIAQGTTLKLVLAYRVLCVVSLFAVVIRWLYWRWALQLPKEFALGPSVIHDLRQHPLEESANRLGPVMTFGSTDQRNPRAPNRLVAPPQASMVPTWCGDSITQAFARLPGNQLLEIEVNVKTLHLPNLPSAFDGISIAHVSDFHLTGRLTRAFYEQVAELVSSLDCDVAVLAGDIIDKAHCLDWLQPIFSPVHAREERLFVLGNHDKRIKDETDLRRRMREAGWRDVSGSWWLQQRDGATLAWSGNELPWYFGARQLPARSKTKEETRVLIAHSPDQIDFAQVHDFDLVLAGHTHGGQIKPPLIGPVISPSHYGPKYASGEFRVGKTWMHVSRGVAGTHVVRLNCRPEITRLVLRCGRSSS